MPGGTIMPILWLMEWAGITTDQYEELRKAVDWEGNVPEGLHYHVAAFDNRTMVVSEVWESPDHVQPFMDERFLPAVKQLGITSMPKVDLYETHAIFAPAAG
jgi:hypothetical protein